MNRDQKIVLTGALTGVVTMVAAMWGLSHALPVPSGIETTGDKLAYALRWNVFAALPLFAMFAAIGNARFLGEAIDPLRGAEDRTMVINGRVAANTLEQFVLFFAATLALAAQLDTAMLPVLGAAAITFTVARIVFWIGYRIDPLYRAPGFSSTAYLNGGLLVWACWLCVSARF